MDTVPPYVIKTSGSTKLNPRPLNIDGSDDQFYRYKVRQLYVQVVGKGKMIKTVLLNIDDVAKDLKVSPAYATAYIGYEIGAQAKHDPKKPDREKASISGDRDAHELSLIMQKFVSEVVLCPLCKLPETTMHIAKPDSKGGEEGSSGKNSSEVFVTCRGCGNISALNLRPKFKQFILNHPNLLPQQSKEEKAVRKKQEATAREGQQLQASSSSSSASVTSTDEKSDNGVATSNGSAEAPKKEKRQKKKKQDEEEDDLEWFVDTSEEAVRQRRHDLLPDRIKQLLLGEQAEKDAVIALQNLLKDNSKTVSQDVVKQVEAIKANNSFDNNKTIALFFDALPPNCFDILPYKPILQSLVTDETIQATVLKRLEDQFSGSGVTEKQLKRLVFVLKELYDSDILEEESLLRWHTTISSPSVARSVSPFIVWLQNAEEASEEE